jgi:flagellar assembly protein FliH
MTKNATKFTFDTVFGSGQEFSPERVRAHGRKTLTDAEIETLCANAKAEGASAAEARALESIASGTREAANAVIKAMNATRENLETVRAEAMTVAFALARKIASAAVATFPAGEVEAALRGAMHEAIGEPRIVLHAKPEVVEALSGRIAEIAHEEGYDGRVQLSADAALNGADCRIDWRGGGAERTNAAIEAAIDELMARCFAAARAGQNGSET